MADTPALADLREPPVIGRFYMVPVVDDYPYLSRWDQWPVLGPKHTDIAHFNFPDQHYHLDARFLTARQRQFLTRRGLPWSKTDPVAAIVQASPLNYRGIPLPSGRPRLARRKCTGLCVPYIFADRTPVKAMRADYPSPAHPIRKPDGRLLCPHRKVNLSSFAPDADGNVTCPLHGLIVQCGLPQQGNPA